MAGNCSIAEVRRFGGFLFRRRLLSRVVRHGLWSRVSYFPIRFGRTFLKYPLMVSDSWWSGVRRENGRRDSSRTSRTGAKK